MDGSRFTPTRLLQTSGTEAAPAVVDTATSYCLRFNQDDLAKCVCHVLVKDMYIHTMPGLNTIVDGDGATQGNVDAKGDSKTAAAVAGADTVTVVTVAWAHDYYSGHLAPLLESLPTGVHVIIVLASLGQQYPIVPQPPTTVTVVEVDISSCAHSDARLLPDKVCACVCVCVCVWFNSPSTPVQCFNRLCSPRLPIIPPVSLYYLTTSDHPGYVYYLYPLYSPDTQVLYNIGLDLAPTDSVLVLPAGMELVTGDDAFTSLAR